MKKIWKIIFLTSITLILLPLSSFPVISTNNDQSVHLIESNPMENIEITCSGPIWPMIILRGNVFSVKIANRNNESYTYRSTFSVRRPNGIIFLGPLGDPAQEKLEPNKPVNYYIWAFSDFRKAWCLFGFFYVTYKLELWPEDDTYHKITKEFPGVIFGISAIILDSEGKII